MAAKAEQNSEGTSTISFVVKLKLVLVVFLGVMLASWYYSARIPANVLQPLEKLQAAVFDGNLVPDVVPARQQVPLLIGLLASVLMFLGWTTFLSKLNPKTVGFMLVCVVGGGAFFAFQGNLFAHNWESYPEIDDQINGLEKIAQTGTSTDGQPMSARTSEETVGNNICTTETYKVGKDFNSLILLDPTTDVIYPGALIKGESIMTGEYTPIVVDRQPISISVSLENIDGDASRIIKDPKLSTVRSAIKEVLNQRVTGSTAARNTFEITEVKSSEHLKVAVGANYSYSGGMADISASFGFNSNSENNHYLLKFIQSYYTIDMDSPKNASHVFSNPEEYNAAKIGSISPMYVASVTYGRMAFFSIESSKSSEEIEAALNASFQSGLSAGKLNIDAEHASTLSNCKITGTIIGGSGEDAANAIWGLEGMKNYINNGGNWSHDSPAQPLAYKLRYLKDNSIGNIIMTSEYEVRNCVPISEAKMRKRYRVTLLTLNAEQDADSDLEICGDIKVTANIFKADRAMPSESKSLWSSITYDGSNWRDPSQPNYLPNLSAGGRRSLNKTVEFTFDDPDTLRSSFVIGGKLIEADGVGENDLIGQDSKRFLLSEIDSRVAERKLTFSGSEGTVNIDYKVELIGSEIIPEKTKGN